MTLQPCTTPPSIDAAHIHATGFAGEHAAAQSRQFEVAVSKGFPGVRVIDDVVFAKSPVVASMSGAVLDARELISATI